MKLIGRSSILASGLVLAASLAGGFVSGVPTAWAVTASASVLDTTAPTAPTNLRQTGTYGGQAILGWDVATDDSGTIDHYSVLVDGTQVYRPRLPETRIYDLVQLCHLLPGHTYTITIKAVDPSGNRSEPSDPLQVTVL